MTWKYLIVWVVVIIGVPFAAAWLWPLHPQPTIAKLVERIDVADVKIQQLEHHVQRLQDEKNSMRAIMDQLRDDIYDLKQGKAGE